MPNLIEENYSELIEIDTSRGAPIVIRLQRSNV